jgi:nitroreductase
LPDAIDEELLKQILTLSLHAPSGGNLQPWRLEVVIGEARERLSQAILDYRHAGHASAPEYGYYPTSWHEPYRSRRRDAGLALYRSLGIEREDQQRREAIWEENYRFFGAPVGILIFVDRRLGQGSWIDIGILLQTLMLSATALGLATCPQAALADYPNLIRHHLAVGDEWLLTCGVALGYPDPDHPINSYRLDRASLNQMVRIHK